MSDQDELLHVAHRVALVVVDLDVPHLDHAFEYLIPDGLNVQIGSRVAVTFAGRRHYGWVVGLASSSLSGKKLQQIKRVIGPFPLVTEGTIKTAEYLAARYASNLKQILSFALPTRRASVEKEFANGFVQAEVSSNDRRTVARSVTSIYPGQMFDTLAAAVESRPAGGVTALVLPTSSLAQAVFTDLSSRFPQLSMALADADQSDAGRYRVHLRALMNELSVVVGTRSSVWTPMPRGGSIVIWDDGDDRLREKRSPRLDALDIAVARSHVEHLDLLTVSFARSVKAQALVESRWAADTSPDRAEGLTLVPKIRVFDWADADREGAPGRSRFPDAAYRLIRDAIGANFPVLIQVAASGYVTELGFPECGEPRTVIDTACPNPSHEYGRKLRIGADRVREELQLAFPGVPVLVSSSTSGVLTSLVEQPSIVVATASAEPRAQVGYGAVIIAEAESVVYTSRLDAQVEAERRWMGALSLAAPGTSAMIIGTLPPALEQSVVRWQSQILAAEELAVRRELGFPPARWLVTISGEATAVLNTAQQLSSAPEVQVLSVSDPTAGFDGVIERTLVASCEPRFTNLMMTMLRTAQVERSRMGQSLMRIEVNPPRMDV